MKRILCLDVGTKTIGVAISDGLGMIAQGIKTIERKSFKKDFAELRKFKEEYPIELILVGLPLNMNGSDSAQTELVRNFCKKLENSLQMKVELWDERLSTAAVERVLIDADMSRKKRKKVVDKLAAVYILQGYLDSRSLSAVQE